MLTTLVVRMIFGAHSNVLLLVVGLVLFSAP